MALCEKILLIGFSGAGKTTLLNYLKADPPSGLVFFDDLDGLVFQKYGSGLKDLHELISKVGWEKFREWEQAELNNWMKLAGKGVLALGGGAFTEKFWEQNKNSIEIKFCHLRASFETCWERLQTSDELRPLALKGKEHLYQIYLQRKPLFEKIDCVLENEEDADLEELKKKFIQCSL